MKDKKIDRRIKYTNMVLRQSLLDLMKVMPIEKITITRICQHADINRATFYMHYDSVRDLLDQIQNEYYNSLQSSVKKLLNQNMNASLLLGTFQELAVHSDLCKIMFGKYGDKEFLKKFKNISNEFILYEGRIIPKITDSQKYAQIKKFIISGCTGIVQDWVQRDFQESPQEMADFVSQMIQTVFRGFPK